MNADTFIKRITVKAGKETLKMFGKATTRYVKSEYLWDNVTKADLKADKLIVSAIQKQFPTHGIQAEESGAYQTDAEYVWYIDPIDGTLNFANRIPMFATMVALAKRGRVILAAVYLPVTDELYFAKKGKGAYVNGKRIRTSQNRDFDRSNGCAQFSMSETNIAIFRNIFDRKEHRHVIASSLGSMGVNGCYVAAGRRDWIIAPHGAVHDFAAPSLILSESGCTVTTLSGKPWSLEHMGLVAANPSIHKELLKLTKDV